MTLAELDGRATVPLEDALPFYGVGRTTAYTLAREGRLPGCRRLGGRYVVVVPALLEWLGAQPQECSEAPAGASLTSQSPSPTPGVGPARPPRGEDLDPQAY